VIVGHSVNHSLRLCLDRSDMSLVTELVLADPWDTWSEN